MGDVPGSDDLKIKSIVVVGGGTAGWSVARFFSEAFENNIQIRMIESPDISPVPIGESTAGPYRDFVLNHLRFDEKDFVTKCHITFKVCTRYVDWQYAKGERFHGGFQAAPLVGDYFLYHYWLYDYLAGKTTVPFEEAALNISTVCDHFKSPVDFAGDAIPFAYHFDTARLHAYFRQTCLKQNNVQLIAQTVTSVIKDDQDCISAVVLDNGERIEGDFFVDCTGFKAALMSMAYDNPLQSWDHFRPCGSAVALQRPRTEHKVIHPYTESRAVRSGWVWNIPLWETESFGYVYSADHESPETAEAYLRQHLDYQDGDAHHLRWKSGRRTPWVKNCLAVGLSHWFFEPIEAMTITNASFMLKRFLYSFPTKQIDQDLIDRFNLVENHTNEEIRNFMLVHYHLSQRKDTPFWKSLSSLPVPDALARILDRNREVAQCPTTLEPPYAFNDGAWHQLLSGKGYYPKHTMPNIAYIQSKWSRYASEAFDRVRTKNEKIKHYQWPTHQNYLDLIYRYASDDVGSAE